MRRARSSQFTRITTAIRAAFCAALALSSVAHAQTAETQMPGAYFANDQFAYGAPAQQPATARGIFAATIATLIAQGLGHGIGSALSQGVGGSITNWFGGAADRSYDRASNPAVASVPNEPLTFAQPHAGVAYEVHLLGQDGAARPVDAARHVFRTNDRFQVHYRPALPGRVNILNVNPQGREAQIDSIEVAAGQLTTLGPYQFVGAKGKETLKLVLEPCLSPSLGSETRAIAKANQASAGEPAFRLGQCADALPRSARAKARTIRKVTIEGSTAFALDPLSSDEMQSGRLDAREIRIALQHR